MIGIHGYGIGGIFLLSIFFRLVYWIIIVLVGYFLIKSLMKKGGIHQAVGKSALDIAKERYAKGEINKEEFEEIKTNLV